MGKTMVSIEDVVSEMRRLKSKLPARPSPDEVKYATQAVERVDANLSSRLEELFQLSCPSGVPYHVFRAYLKMREDLIRKKAEDEKRMSVSIQELEARHQRYDSLIHTAQSAASHPLHNSAVHDGSAYDYKQPVVTTPDGSKHNSLPTVSEDNSFSAPLSRGLSIGHLGGRSFKGSTSTLKSDTAVNSSSKTPFTQAAPTSGLHPDNGNEEDGIRRYSPQVLREIEKAKINGLLELKLTNMDIEWIPEMIGELTNLTSLDLSGNRMKILPESIGELINLVCLNIQANELKALPETIGCLTNLRHLNMQMNKIEELPMTIGLCTKLEELIADFNDLKVLPEATGQLISLRKLSIHLNHVHRLPTTLKFLTNLEELDARFNQLERVPDSLCYLPKLRKLDISSNFTEMRELPQAIGQMQSLRELNISSTQIKTLPLSFAMLTGLEKLEMFETPLELPPRDVVQKGKEAVIQFMIELASQEKRDEKEIVKKSGFGSRLSSFFKRKKTQDSSYRVKRQNDLHIRA